MQTQNVRNAKAIQSISTETTQSNEVDHGEIDCIDWNDFVECSGPRIEYYTDKQIYHTKMEQTSASTMNWAGALSGRPDQDYLPFCRLIYFENCRKFIQWFGL